MARADHWHHREDDDYTQPDLLFRLMSPVQQAVLFSNTVRTTGDAPREAKVHYIENCMKADPHLRQGGSKRLGFVIRCIEIV